MLGVIMDMILSIAESINPNPTTTNCNSCVILLMHYDSVHRVDFWSSDRNGIIDTEFKSISRSKGPWPMGCPWDDIFFCGLEFQ